MFLFFLTTISFSLQLLAQNIQIMPPTGQMKKLVELICQGFFFFFYFKARKLKRFRIVTFTFKKFFLKLYALKMFSMVLKIMLEVNYVGQFQLESKFHYFYQVWSSLALNHSMLYQVVFLVIKLFFSTLESSVVMQKLIACLFSYRSFFFLLFSILALYCSVDTIR